MRKGSDRTPLFGKFDGPATLGGANPDNDGRYINGPNRSVQGQTPGFGESAVDFLKNRAPKLGKPFCLFVSLINPHDVTSIRQIGKRRATSSKLSPN
jgi:hypothetical protein